MFALWVVVASLRPQAWLFVLPAALPFANLSPWTGWIACDEFDLLALGAVAAGGLHRARMHRQTPSASRQRGADMATTLVCGFACASAIALVRGLLDAGAWPSGLYEGYVEPLNTIRVFKPVVYVLALLPLTRQALQVFPAGSALRSIAWGMCTGLAIVSLAALWERATYPGLLDFAARYRTTALFWEMHIGGGAIDVYLAMATPFAAWALYSASGPLRWGAAAALALLAAHACLTTFSRGVYLGAGLPLLFLGGWLASRRLGFASRRWLLRLAGVGIYGTAAAGLMALVFAAYGQDGLGMATFVGVLSLLVLAWQSNGPQRRRMASAALALAILAEIVLVLNPTSFMRERMAAGDRDFGGRLGHWRSGLALLRTPADVIFGIGLGRLPARYAASTPGREFSGSVALQGAEGAEARGVILRGPATLESLEGLYGLTQRVPIGRGGPYRVRLRAQAAQPAVLAIAVCEMHLLYVRECQTEMVRIEARPPDWQSVDLAPRGDRLSLGKLVPPREGVFWLSAATAGGQLVVDDISLTDDGGPELLGNRRFADGLAHWLPSATGYFVPWHIDNTYLEVLIERGVLGLVCFIGMIACAVHNIVAGSTERTVEVPFFAASLTGALIVGALSSVMDAPRASFLLQWLLMILAFRATMANG